MGEVDRRQFDLLALDVLPDVELSPVRKRKDPEVLADAVATVEEIPQLRSLTAWIPLAELVAKRVDALLRPGLLLVPSTAAENGVEAMLASGPRRSRPGRSTLVPTR
jgi:hypothetical protein